MAIYFFNNNKDRYFNSSTPLTLIVKIFWRTTCSLREQQQLAILITEWGIVIFFFFVHQPGVWQKGLGLLLLALDWPKHWGRVKAKGFFLEVGEGGKIPFSFLDNTS